MALVRAGLWEARATGEGMVIVLGHPHCYPRFGFERAAECGIRPPFDAPAGAFMALPLRPGALEGVYGTVEYPPEFSGV